MGTGDPKILMFAQQTRYCLNHLPSPQLDHSLLGTLSYVCVCGGGGIWWQASMAFIYFSPLPVIIAQCLLGRKLLQTVPLLFCERLGGGAGTKRANLVPLSLPLTEALLPLSRQLRPGTSSDASQVISPIKKWPSLTSYLVSGTLRSRYSKEV